MRPPVPSAGEEHPPAPFAPNRDEIEIRLAQNAKAIHFLYCALSPSIFNKISSCATTKGIRDQLLITFEGANRVRDTKINILLENYEIFRMKSN